MNCQPHRLARAFTQRNIERLPENAFGVYGLWCNKICLYVGKAEKQSLRVRLMNHFNDCHNPDLRGWLHAYSKDIVFVVKSIANKNCIHDYERRFIALYCPRTNKTK